MVDDPYGNAWPQNQRDHVYAPSIPNRDPKAAPKQALQSCFANLGLKQNDGCSNRATQPLRCKEQEDRKDV